MSAYRHRRRHSNKISHGGHRSASNKQSKVRFPGHSDNQNQLRLNARPSYGQNKDHISPNEGHYHRWRTSAGHSRLPPWRKSNNRGKHIKWNNYDSSSDDYSLKLSKYPFSLPTAPQHLGGAGYGYQGQSQPAYTADAFMSDSMLHAPQAHENTIGIMDAEGDMLMADVFLEIEHVEIANVAVAASAALRKVEERLQSLKRTVKVAGRFD